MINGSTCIISAKSIFVCMRSRKKSECRSIFTVAYEIMSHRKHHVQLFQCVKFPMADELNQWHKYNLDYEVRNEFQQ